MADAVSPHRRSYLLKLHDWHHRTANNRSMKLATTFARTTIASMSAGFNASMVERATTSSASSVRRDAPSTFWSVASVVLLFVSNVGGIAFKSFVHHILGTISLSRYFKAASYTPISSDVPPMLWNHVVKETYNHLSLLFCPFSPFGEPKYRIRNFLSGIISTVMNVSNFKSIGNPSTSALSEQR